jgi:hypothetical protein
MCILVKYKNIENKESIQMGVSQTHYEAVIHWNPLNKC